MLHNTIKGCLLFVNVNIFWNDWFTDLQYVEVADFSR